MPRVVDHRARRAEIVAAVFRLVAREGAEAVTVRRVAAEAGVSTGALAHYFSDKDELLTAAFTEVVARGHYRMQALSQDRDVAELLFQMLIAPLPLNEERRTESRVWFAFLDRGLAHKEAAALLRAVYGEWRRSIGEIVAMGQRMGRFRADLDPQETASSLIATVDGITMQAVVDPEALDPDVQRRLIRSRIETLLAG